MNSQSAVTTLTSDGELHRQRRSVLMRPMMPGALAEVREGIEQLASEVVSELVARDSFDGIADFARRLPVAVVSRLVGLPEAGRERMLDWAKATFDALGPMNDAGARCTGRVPRDGEVRGRASGATRSLRAAGRCACSKPRSKGSSRPTTSAVCSSTTSRRASTRRSSRPDTSCISSGATRSSTRTCERIPSRVAGAVHEALRFESPVRAFTRLAVARLRSRRCVDPEGRPRADPLRFGESRRAALPGSGPLRRHARRTRSRRPRLRCSPLCRRLPRAARDGIAAPRDGGAGAVASRSASPSS